MRETIAYLINQYPKVSHSFIRREILGIEKSGIKVERFSIRSCGGELVDIADKEEEARTRVILGVGLSGLLWGLASVGFRKPIGFLKALRLAIQLNWRSDRSIFHHLAYLAEACVLFQWLLEAKVTHVHAHFGTNSTTVAMLCKVLGGPPYSFTIHGPEEFDKVESLSLVEKIRRAAFVVTISSFGKSQLYRWCEHEQWSKIHVVHCGVDNSFLTQSSIALSPEKRVVCVGRLCEAKGHLLLLEAMNQLVAEGLQFKLVLVGDGPLRREITALAAQLGLEDNVEITGWSSSFEVRQHILASRVLVLPSFAEGLPVVIMEALALGCPVISTYVAGIPELIESGVCGWLVPPGSVEALAAAMRDALQMSAEDLKKMGKRGAERVAQRHVAEAEASKLAKIFQSYSSQLPKRASNTPLDEQHADIHITQISDI